MDNRLKLLSVALLVVPAGCADGAVDGGAGNVGGAESVSFTADASGSAEAEQTDDDDLPQAQRRAVIRNGQMELAVDELSELRDTVESTTESYGGYVSDSNEYINRRSGGTCRSDQLIVHVPSEDFSTSMIDMRTLGEVEHVETNSENVTDQLIDTEARLSNLRTQRDRLCDLYESANTTEDVLAVEECPTDAQTEIERPEAQKQLLEDRATFSIVRISLSERLPGPVQWYDTPVLQVSSESVDGVFVALRTFVAAVVYAIPYLVIFGGLLTILGGEVAPADRATFRQLVD